MTSVVVAVAVLAPWFAAAAFALARGDGPRWLLPLASVPALAVALLPAAPEPLAAPVVLLGLQLRLDHLARAALLLVGVAWTASAWFAMARLRERFRGFALFWLGALAGLVLAALAAELASFYTGYVLMTLASYGLVVHERSDAALRAARVYMVLAILGEAMLLAGVLLVAAQLGNAPLEGLAAALRGPHAPWIAALLLGGLGVKIGLVPLHLWLPVAHPVAPVPASAILSGVIVKAGLLGALRVVPASPFEAGDATAALVVLGLFTAFYGAAVGVTQTKMKTLLAYSTVSQMGLWSAGLAVSLGAPDRGAPLMALLILHHGLNKAALFLAAGCSPGATRARRWLLALPALSLAGFPLTSGELAKGALKSALSHGWLGDATVPLLGLASAATALLMLRLWALARADDTPAADAPLHPAWPVLVLAGLAVPWLWAVALGPLKLPDPTALLHASWPLALAVAIAWVWRRFELPLRPVPAGDLLVPAEASVRAVGRVARALRPGWPWPPKLPVAAWADRAADRVRRAERALVTLPAAGLVLLSLVALVWWALG